MENLVEKEKQKKVHSVNIMGREKIDIVGAIEVLSSTDSQVISRVCDFVMVISGSDLRITKLLPEESFFSISGKIDGVKYENKISKKSFFGKVFK